jgi:GTP-sensing pleiotropic transcriptional regulator CodY
VIEIIKHSFKISNTDFSDNLTIAEKEGLDYILSQIGKEGIVSINNLSKETGISRPVFNNLIAKMKTAKVAIIQNMGAKGTYIKITNLNLLKKGEK